ncbi:hypothetical protein CQ018_13955 [Arthrobacter sp. MYb227]|uniref:transglutaminase family protein n=1 Tax=Arthrobacter sp. MYb227 TaxID=1848601 RepID=UPI000CFBECEF|nr:DUF3488 and transglutaminase-like domain-containing protein [Arthrobacter sp. MYb227]PQZ91066.1 hypothetical protein CQ018_13955 [Arthrobacter sp. MYb227]
MSASTLTRARSQAEPPSSPTALRSGKSRISAFFAFAATAFAVLAATASLHGVISDWGWMVQVGIVVVVLLLVTNTARYFVVPRFLPPVLGLLAAILTMTFLFFANTAFLGFIPTSATYQALLQVWELANTQMGSQVPPVPSTGVIVFSVTIWAAVISLAVDTLAFTLRAPVIAGIPLALFLTIASLFEPQGAGIGSVATTGVGFLFILAAARRLEVVHPKLDGHPVQVETLGSGSKLHVRLPAKPGNSMIQGVVVLVGALITMLLLPGIVPGFSKGMLVEGTRPSWGNVATNIDPMIALGNDLRSSSSGQVLRYYTDATSPLYLRTSVIGNLEGTKWKPDDSLLRVPVSESLPVPMFPTMISESHAVITRVVTDRYRGAWLPVPGNLTSVEGLSSNWQWIPDTSTVLTQNPGQSAEQDFIGLSQEPKITSQTLHEASRQLDEGYFDSVNPEYSQLPNNVPKSVNTVIEKATAGVEDATAYEQAVAIQDYLRSKAFTYSEKTPVQDGYDGSGMDVIAAFLEKKSGYCIHFASTMALMARTLNIPSRIVTGYSPGDPSGDSVTSSSGTKLNEFSVTSRNAHAWPELYFPGAGWVAFEPTPGRGVPPAYAPAQAAPTPSQGEDPRLTNPTAKRSEQSAPTSPSAQSGAATNQPSADEPVSPWPWLGALAIVLIAGVPLLMRRIQRSTRISAIEKPGTLGSETGAAAAWAELVALGIDHAKPMRQDESAGDYSRRLAKHFATVSADLQMLATSYEHQNYSQTTLKLFTTQELTDALENIGHAMAKEQSFGSRLCTVLWPRSVFAPKPLETAHYLGSK